MRTCFGCGQIIETNQKHTHEDCMKYLENHAKKVTLQLTVYDAPMGLTSNWKIIDQRKVDEKFKEKIWEDFSVDLDKL